MPQENTIGMILFHWFTICEVSNAGNTVIFKVFSEDKLCEVYATFSSVSAGDTITGRITSNYCNYHVQQFIAIKLYCSTAH